MTSRRTLVVCTGGHCRKARGHDALLSLARSEPGSCTISCQGICDGPVAGLRDGAKVRWYRKVRSKRYDLLRSVLHDKKRRKRLRSFEVRRRRDTMRHADRLKPARASAR